MTDTTESTPAVADLLARARVYVEGSHAKQTLEGYAADWKHFTSWCEEHKRRSLPAAPETIICYLVETADSYRVATLDRRLASISYHRKQARHALPTKDPPFSFRDPVMLARQAAALDDLSGGRCILGVGAGWGKREHAMFGYDLGNVLTSLDRLAEGLEVTTSLLRSDHPVTFEGRFFQLREATLLPRPQRPGGPPILLPASGTKRSMPLVARYADIQNTVWQSPAEFRKRSEMLDGVLQSTGRRASDVKRTLMTFLFYGDSQAKLERQVRAIRRFLPHLAELPLDRVLETLRTEWNALMGTPDEIIARIQDYVAAGVEELMLEWLDPDDLDSLAAFAAEVLPRVSAGDADSPAHRGGRR